MRLIALVLLTTGTGCLSAWVEAQDDDKHEGEGGRISSVTLRAEGLTLDYSGCDFGLEDVSASLKIGGVSWESLLDVDVASGNVTGAAGQIATGTVRPIVLVVSDFSTLPPTVIELGLGVARLCDADVTAATMPLDLSQLVYMTTPAEMPNVPDDSAQPSCDDGFNEAAKWFTAEMDGLGITLDDDEDGTSNLDERCP